MSVPDDASLAELETFVDSDGKVVEDVGVQEELVVPRTDYSGTRIAEVDVPDAARDLCEAAIEESKAHNDNKRYSVFWITIWHCDVESQVRLYKHVDDLVESQKIIRYAIGTDGNGEHPHSHLLLYWYTNVREEVIKFALGLDSVRFTPVNIRRRDRIQNILNYLKKKSFFKTNMTSDAVKSNMDSKLSIESIIRETLKKNESPYDIARNYPYLYGKHKSDIWASFYGKLMGQSRSTEGNRILILGKSGCGKTTLVKTLVQVKNIYYYELNPRSRFMENYDPIYHTCICINELIPDGGSEYFRSLKRFLDPTNIVQEIKYGSTPVLAKNYIVCTQYSPVDLLNGFSRGGIVESQEGYAFLRRFNCVLFVTDFMTKKYREFHSNSRRRDLQNTVWNITKMFEYILNDYANQPTGNWVQCSGRLAMFYDSMSQIEARHSRQSIGEYLQSYRLSKDWLKNNMGKKSLELRFSGRELMTVRSLSDLLRTDRKFILNQEKNMMDEEEHRLEEVSELIEEEEDEKNPKEKIEEVVESENQEADRQSAILEGVEYANKMLEALQDQYDRQLRSEVHVMESRVQEITLQSEAYRQRVEILNAREVAMVQGIETQRRDIDEKIQGMQNYVGGLEGKLRDSNLTGEKFKMRIEELSESVKQKTDDINQLSRDLQENVKRLEELNREKSGLKEEIDKMKSQMVVIQEEDERKRMEYEYSITQLMGEKEADVGNYQKAVEYIAWFLAEVAKSRNRSIEEIMKASSAPEFPKLLSEDYFKQLVTMQKEAIQRGVQKERFALQNIKVITQILESLNVIDINGMFRNSNWLIQEARFKELGGVYSQVADIVHRVYSVKASAEDKLLETKILSIEYDADVDARSGSRITVPRKQFSIDKYQESLEYFTEEERNYIDQHYIIGSSDVRVNGEYDDQDAYDGGYDEQRLMEDEEIISALAVLDAKSVAQEVDRYIDEEVNPYSMYEGQQFGIEVIVQSIESALEKRVQIQESTVKTGYILVMSNQVIAEGDHRYPLLGRNILSQEIDPVRLNIITLKDGNMEESLLDFYRSMAVEPHRLQEVFTAYNHIDKSKGFYMYHDVAESTPEFDKKYLLFVKNWENHWFILCLFKDERRLYIMNTITYSGPLKDAYEVQLEDFVKWLSRTVYHSDGVIQLAYYYLTKPQSVDSSGCLYFCWYYATVFYQCDLNRDINVFHGTSYTEDTEFTPQEEAMYMMLMKNTYIEAVMYNRGVHLGAKASNFNWYYKTVTTLEPLRKLVMYFQDIFINVPQKFEVLQYDALRDYNKTVPLNITKGSVDGKSVVKYGDSKWAVQGKPGIGADYFENHYFHDVESQIIQRNTELNTARLIDSDAMHYHGYYNYTGLDWKSRIIASLNTVKNGDSMFCLIRDVLVDLLSIDKNHAHILYLKTIGDYVQVDQELNYMLRVYPAWYLYIIKFHPTFIGIPHLSSCVHITAGAIYNKNVNWKPYTAAKWYTPVNNPKVLYSFTNFTKFIQLNRLKSYLNNFKHFMTSMGLFTNDRNASLRNPNFLVLCRSLVQQVKCTDGIQTNEALSTEVGCIDEALGTWMQRCRHVWIPADLEVHSEVTLLDKLKNVLLEEGVHSRKAICYEPVTFVQDIMKWKNIYVNVRQRLLVLSEAYLQAPDVPDEYPRDMPRLQSSSLNIRVVKLHTGNEQRGLFYTGTQDVVGPVIITEYMGMILTETEFQSVYPEGNAVYTMKTKKHHYEHGDLSNVNGLEAMYIDSGVYGNNSRFINQGNRKSDNTCKFEEYLVGGRVVVLVILQEKKVLHHGQEILVDYGRDYQHYGDAAPVEKDSDPEYDPSEKAVSRNKRKKADRGQMPEAKFAKRAKK